MPLPVPRPSRYRLYIDESGDHTYNLLDEPSHRYLALLGVWFRQADDYVAFADDLDKFKRELFGPRPDKPVILHRKVDNIAGLQLADVLAHPVKQACLLESNLITDTGEAFGKEVCRAVKEKFNINRWRGQVEGGISVQFWSVSAERPT